MRTTAIHLRGLAGAALIVWATLGTTAHAAPVLQVVNGTLMGADDVLVQGQLYDVRFVEGTCAEVFGACQTERFEFQSVESANAASHALISTVFIDGPAGKFDTGNSSTYGCNDTFGVPFCEVWTPFDIFGDLTWNMAAVNGFNRFRNQVYDVPVGYSYDTLGIKTAVWARWTSVPDDRAEVPEPASLWLVGAALCGLVLRRRSA